MRNSRHFVLLAILLLGILAGCTAPAPAATAPEAAAPAADAPADAAPAANQVVIAAGQPIRIGGSFALTGPIPDPGKDIRQAAEIAVDELNATGGVEGFLFELVTEDGGCSGDQGTVVGNKFAADPTIVAVSGGTCSGETIGLKPILLKARIPFVSPSATNPDVISADCDVCNRVALSDALQGEVDADFVFNTLGLKKVAAMHDNSDYGKGLSEIFQTAFIALGGEVSDFEGVQVGDTDFRAALAKIGANQPELIYFGGYSTEAALIAQQMKETAGLESAKFMSVDGAYTQQFLQAAGAAAEGAYMSFVAGDSQTEMLDAFTAAYVAKFGVEPSQLGPFHGQSHDSIMVIADAIKRTAQVDEAGNLVIDREALIAAVRATAGLAGITGTLSCDAMGECGAGGIQIFIVENGEFKQISGFGL